MSEEWSDEELKAAVAAYLEMFNKYKRGRGFVKKEYYKELAETYGRSVKAFEYRMQNISHVFCLMNRPFLPGLKPKQNVGQRNIERIRAMIAEMESIPFYS